MPVELPHAVGIDKEAVAPEQDDPPLADVDPPFQHEREITIGSGYEPVMPKSIAKRGSACLNRKDGIMLSIRNSLLCGVVLRVLRRLVNRVPSPDWNRLDPT